MTRRSRLPTTPTLTSTTMPTVTDDAGAANDDDATDDGAMDPAEPELFEFNDDGTEKAPGASSSKKVLSEKALAKARKDQAKRGVIYLGSIPPFMKPQKLRQLLTPYGNLDRMYLMPEDPEMRARRKKFKVGLLLLFPYGQLD